MSDLEFEEHIRFLNEGNLPQPITHDEQIARQLGLVFRVEVKFTVVEKDQAEE